MTLGESRTWSPFCYLPDDRVETVTMVRGAGAYVYDSDRRCYLDGTAGLWYSLIGHGREEMAVAIADQVRSLEAFKTHGEYDNIPARELSRRLAALLPVENPLVFFTSSGGESVETACKLARSYWRVSGRPSKRILLSRSGAYHGMNGFGTRVVGIEDLRDGYDDGYPAKVVAAAEPAALASAIEDLGADRIAAFIAEPVIGAGGVILPPEGYLTEVQALCHEHDILFICDEIITAFGRLGQWSGSAMFGIQPDLMTLAKGITSGYVPLGAVVASERVWGAFEAARAMFRHGYTYSGHPTACAAALQNLDILEDERIPEHVAQLAPRFASELATLSDHALVNEVRAIGLMAGIGLDHGNEQAVERGLDLGTELVRRCRDHGVIVRRMFQGDLQISPPLIITEEDVTALVQGVGSAIGELGSLIAGGAK